MQNLRSLLTLVCLMAVASSTAFPQASTAILTGTVHDQSNAVIVGAKLTLTNRNTGTKSETASNQSGLYVFPGIIPGAYELEATSAGMDHYIANFNADVAQKLTIDPVLKPGSTSTTVEVKDVTPLVNLTDSIDSHLIENQDIDQIPRFGRQISSITAIVPGFAGTYQADGLRYGSTDWSLDGGPLVSRSRGTVENRQPGIDSIQELSIDTNNVSAKYNSPVAIIISTKSGTNQVHGSIFETIQNSGIYYARQRNQGNASPAYSNINEFGASIGGPVVLPKVYKGKDKTFFFFSWESRRQLSNAFVNYSVPTVAMRAGDFSGLVNSNGIQTKIYDPYTTTLNAATGAYIRDQFNYNGKLNVIDPAKVSPLWTALMKITPLPTLDNVNPLISSNWYGNAVTRWNDNTYATRVDHRFTPNDVVYVRYSKNDMIVDTPFSGDVPALTNDTNRNAYTSPAQSLATSYTKVISPTLFNELLASVYRQTFYQSSNPTTPTDYAAKLGLPNPYGGQQWPDILTIGLNGSAWRTVYPNADYSTFYQLNDNLTKVKGKHQLTAGIHLRRDIVNYLPQQERAAGQVSPVANWTALWNPAGSASSPSATTNTGSTIASSYLGLNNYQAETVHKFFYERQNQYALYFQDQWKVTRNLSLSLGVRWEGWPAMAEKYGNTVGFDPKTNTLILTQTPAEYDRIVPGFATNVSAMQALGVKFEDYKQAGLPKSLQFGNWKDFSPRVGFAYRLQGGSHPLVIRGGFSIAYYPPPMYNSLEQIRASEPYLTYPLYSPDSSGFYPDGAPGYSLRSKPTYIAGLNTTNVLSGANITGLTAGSMNVTYLDPHSPDSKVMDGNITLEKQFWDKTVVRFKWVANHNSNVDIFRNLNPQTPTYVWVVNTKTSYPSAAGATRPASAILGNIQDVSHDGYSNYSGIHVELEHRFSHGFSGRLFFVNNNAYSLGNNNNQGTSTTLYPSSYYLPNQVAGLDQNQLDRLTNYARNTTFPHHQVTWNWVAQIPVGRGKKFLGNAKPWLDYLVGGWQISGLGKWQTTWWAMQSSQFPTGAPLKIYGHSVQVQDCRSGSCLSAYLYSNSGWINPAQVNSHNAAGACTGICGIPSDYQSYSAPLVTDPSSPYFGGNTVTVPLSNGTNYIGAYGGLLPLNNQYFETPGLWTLAASLFKEIPLKERFRMRLQWDVSNPTNSPQEPQSPNANGLIYTYTSGTAARSMQLSARLLW